MVSNDWKEAARVIDRAVMDSPQLLGKECCVCRAVLEYKFFARDSSCRDGRRDICDGCANATRLSIAEHTARLREDNFNSEGTKAQRWAHQDDYRNSESRLGRPMLSGDFLRILKKMVPRLFFMDGNCVGDVAIFETDGHPHTEWGGHDFRYLGYCPTGVLPEFSQYQFDELRDIPIQESRRGWRTPLLRLIESGLITEEMCDAVFGRPDGPASSVWYRHLKSFRNRTA